MVILVIVVSLLAVVVAPILWMIFRGKRSNIISGPRINPLARGPRFRDGAVTYNRLDGMRVRVRVENPYESHTARYERRHHSKKHKSTKPWMK